MSYYFILTTMAIGLAKFLHSLHVDTSMEMHLQYLLTETPSELRVFP